MRAIWVLGLLSCTWLAGKPVEPEALPNESWVYVNDIYWPYVYSASQFDADNPNRGWAEVVITGRYIVLIFGEYDEEWNLVGEPTGWTYIERK